MAIHTHKFVLLYWLRTVKVWNVGVSKYIASPPKSEKSYKSKQISKVNY